MVPVFQVPSNGSGIPGKLLTPSSSPKFPELVFNETCELSQSGLVWVPVRITLCCSPSGEIKNLEIPSWPTLLVQPAVSWPEERIPNCFVKPETSVVSVS